MKRKILCALFVAVYLLICLTPTVGMAFAGPSRPGANEQLASAPVLIRDGNLNHRYLADLTRWINHRFFLRQELISLNNAMEATLFHTSATPDVILGENGWLYYGSTLDDYTGQNPMTPEQLQWAAGNLALVQQYCRETGKDFAFVIAPNKNALYPQNMPAYPVARETNAKALLDLLAQKGVNAVDLFSAFAQQSEILYFAHDSHWNSKGAALGADCINQAFGIQSNYFEADFSGTEDHTGDLFEMLYPAGTDPEKNPVYGDTLNYTVTQGQKADSVTIKTEGSGQGRLAVYRDSFGNLLYPYLADSAESAYFSRSVKYDLTVEADRIVVELVERNLQYLITNAPTMPAPETAAPTLSQILGTVRYEGTNTVRGTLPTAADADKGVYILCGDTAYQAFRLDNNTYSAMLPAQSAPTHLVYTLDGQQQTYTFE